MNKSFTCPHCQATNEWPVYCEGKEITCPQCRRRFLVRETQPELAASASDDIPTALPYDEPPMVLPVEELEPAPARKSKRRQRGNGGGGLPLDCAPSVMEVCERRDLNYLPAPRRLVYALLAAALEKLRPNLLASVLSVLLIPVIVGFAIGLGLVIMTAAYLVALALDAAGVGAGYGLLYLLPIFVVLSAVYFKKSAKIEAITLGKNEQGKAEMIKLGRLDGIFNIAAPATSAFYFGVLLSSQFALLYFLPDHLGVAKEGTVVECIFLTLDNLCQGVLADTFEKNDIHLAEKVEHDWWSGTVFYFFRFSYEAFLLIAAFQLWRHYSMRRLFRRLPSQWRNVAFVCDWIEHASRSEGDWAREFLDEFLFLILAGAYLASDDDTIRGINRRFPWLRVDEEVRRLFVDQHGERLFEYVAERE